MLKKGALSRIEHIDSVANLPCDRQQIRNVRRNLFSVDHKDEFAAILQKCTADNDKPFICCIQVVPEPACIVAINYQLKQMEVNCTDENFSIVTVDPTLNLGEFYVTPMVVMQKKFVRKHTEQHPICLGPLQIELFKLLLLCNSVSNSSTKVMTGLCYWNRWRTSTTQISKGHYSPCANASHLLYTLLSSCNFPAILQNLTLHQ